MSTATTQRPVESAPTYADRARRYAVAVRDGDVLACRLVRLACVRHLRDLERAENDGEYPYYFDGSAAQRICGDIERMPHTKGSWAARRELMRLEDWQCFVLACAFGWKQRSNDRRRFRRVYIEVPRKNGKSQLTAGVGLYMLARDGEHGAEVYSGAGTEKQAWEVFRPARLMAEGMPDFCAFYGVEVNARNISIRASASKFEPIIGKPGDGASPSFAITDEYHEHATDEQYDTMLTGMGAREQPIAWVITTAGSDTAGPCYALRSEVVSMLESTVANDRLFGVIYGIDEGVDWTTEEALRMANPNMGVSVFADYLRAQQQDAINDPRKQSTFKTKHLNVWVTAASPFFNVERWNQLADAPPIADMAGEPCWIGLDLASKRDLAAAVRVFRKEIEGRTHLYVYPRAYCPGEQVHAPERRHYFQWRESGHLTATPGNETDYDRIEADILADAQLHRVVTVAFDAWNAAQMVGHLMNAGVPCREIPQTVKNLSEPMKRLDAMIMDGRVHHDGSPVLSWAMGNITAQVDRNDNVFPRKERPDNKIDPAVAAIMAVALAVSEEGPAVSIYETRGLDIF